MPPLHLPLPCYPTTTLPSRIPYARRQGGGGGGVKERQADEETTEEEEEEEKEEPRRQRGVDWHMRSRGGGTMAW